MLDDARMMDRQAVIENRRNLRGEGSAECYEGGRCERSSGL